MIKYKVFNNSHFRQKTLLTTSLLFIMESTTAIVQNMEHYFDTLDFATLESDPTDSDGSMYEDPLQEELDSELSDMDTMEKQFEEISQVNEKDQTAVNTLIDKLKNCCFCEKNCSEKVSPRLLQSLVLESHQMDKNQRRCSMAILMASAYHEPYEKRAYIEYRLPYLGKVCCPFFHTFWICGKDALYRLHGWLTECKSMLPRPHGNTSRSPKIKLPVETVNKAKSFIKWIGEQHGEAIAVRKYTRKKACGQVTASYEKHDVVLIPSHYSYERLLDAYNIINPEKFIKSRWTFRQIWRSDPELGKIIIRKPSKDKCDECTLFNQTGIEGKC